MASPYRLLALDLDGTTLTKENEITAETANWIRRAASAGITVVIATGRGLSRTRHIWEELCMESPAVLLNGAEIWLGPGKLGRRHYIPREIVREMHRLAVEANAGFWGYDEERLISQRAWSEDTIEREWLKFGMKHDDPEAAARLFRTLQSWGTLEISFAHGRSMEISVRDVTKLSGIAEVCELHGIRMEEVMAVGDAANDLPLLNAVGFPVAMGNAEDIVKKAARGLTDTNDRDGVAKAIQRYIFGLDVDVDVEAEVG